MIPTPEEQATQEKLDLTQGFAVRHNPDEAAGAIRYARENGLPVEAALDLGVTEDVPKGPVTSPLAWKRPPAGAGASWGSLVRAAPVLADTLTDPAFAAVAHDDVPNLQGWEKLFGGWRDMAWATANEWQRGSLNVEASALGRKMLDAQQGRGAWTSTDQARLDDINKQIDAIPEAKLGFFTGVPAMAAQSLPIMIRGMKNAGRETSVGAGAGLVAGALAGAPAGGVGAIPGAAAGFVSGAGIGFTAGTARGAGEDEAGLAMVEYSQTPGVDLKTAAAAATVVGVVNGTLEIIPLEKVLKVVPGAKTWMQKGPIRDFMRKVIKSETGKAAVARFAGRLAEGALLEGMTEFAQEVTTITAGQVAHVAPETTFAQALDRAWGAGVGGAQGGLGFGLWHSTGEFRADLAEARAAQGRKGFYEALGGLAAESKLLARLPEEQRAYLDKLIEKYGAAETISVPAEKLTALFQKEGWTDEDVRTKLPGVASQLAEGNTEIAILTPDFAQNIAPTSGYESLHQDLRVGDEPTIREAAEIEKKAKEVLADFEKLKPDENPVFADIYTKLEGAGFSEQVANRYASLWTAFVENRAKRLGVDPKSYYEGLGLTISHSDLVEAIIPESQISHLSPQMLALRERALQGDRAAMDQLEAEFSKDELTGARGQNAWKRFVSQNPAGVFLAIDANDLKRVNDTLGGHAAGDAFLKAISDAIMPAVQGNKGKFFRSGGDEFSAHFVDRAHADAAVQAITEAMNALPALFEGKHKASISMGLGMSPTQADLASGKAKEPARAKGRSGFGRPGAVSKVDLSGGDVFFAADESPAPEVLLQPAYHGTPHRGIVAFSLGAIGTGEGAQAYGWGLYFAEKLGVAEDYRKRLSGSMIYLDGKLPETEDDKAIVSLLKANGYGDGSPLSFKAAREKAVQYLKNLIEQKKNSADEYLQLAKNAEREGIDRADYRNAADQANRVVAKYEARIERFKEIKHAAVADSYALPLDETISLLRERAQRAIDEIKNSEAQKAGERYAELYDEFLILDEQKDPRRVEVGKEMSRLEKIMPSNAEQEKIDRKILRLERIAGLYLPGEGAPREPIAPGSVVSKRSPNAVKVSDFWDLTQVLSRGGETSFGEVLKHFEQDTGVHTDDLRTPPAGQTYKVDLPEKSELLDSDKALTEQPDIAEKIAASKEIVDALPPGTGFKWTPDAIRSAGLTGMQFYRKLSEALGSDEAASKALLKAGIDGLIYLDGTSRNKGKGTHNFVIWNEQAVKIMEELYQKGANDKQGENYRGKIEFDDTRKWFAVTLTGKANLSTFLHESGHAFLEILRRDAMNGDAQSAADLAIVEAWMAEGTTDRTAQLEKFARGFEAYLYEGNAPSSELTGAFAAFKTWLRFVYSALKSLKVDLTDEVRGVMDRLVATDEEIQKARERTGLFAALGPTELSPGDLAAFQDRYERAVQAKQAEMERDSLVELRRALKDAQTTIRDEVEALSRKDKAFNAAEFLRTGKTLNPEVTLAPEVQGQKLSRKTIHEYVEEGDRRRIKLESMISDTGMDADAMAPYLGYGSGQELVTALLDSPSRAKWIKEQVDARMAEKYPNSTLASLSEKAVTKLHDPLIDSVLESELDAFDKKVGAAPSPRARDVLRLAAKKRVEGMTSQEMQPGKELRAEERAAKDVLAAVAKKDYEAAREARRLQMWHRFMYREMTAAKEEAAKIRDYLHTFEELPTRKRIGKAGERYIEAIDAIIGALDLSKQTDTALARRASLEKYLQEMEAEGEPVAIAPELRAELGIKNWRQMTLDEMRGVHAAVANIAALAKLKNKLFDGRQRRDFVETTTKLAEHVRANVGVNYSAQIGQKSWIEKRKEFFRYARANMSKIEFITRVLDGGKTAGWAHELLFQPLADAQARKYEMSKAITEELIKPLRDMSLKDRLRFDKQVEFLGQKLRYREVIALILNLGNEGNREKLIKGFSAFGFTEQNVQARLDEMYAKGEILDSDLDLVQHIWTTIDKMWPEIAALAQRNVGLAPPKVEATPLKIGSRTLDGGYYPVVYNRDLSHKGEQIAQRKTGDLFENNFLLPSVEKGFTESRTKFFAPVSLSLDVIPNHINEVIHYLTHYEAVRAVDKITSSKMVKEAITEGLGREIYQQFRPWLQAIAADGTVHESTKWYDAVLRRLRLGSSIALLGFKVTTGLKQVFGITASVKEIGAKYTMTGSRIFMENILTGKGWGEISDLSKEFRETEMSLDRDIGAMFRSLEGTFSIYGEAKDKMAHFALAWLMLNQRAVNAVTWYGAREKAMVEGHPDPVAFADSVVRMTQAGGGMKDLAQVQRGSEMERTMTVMYTYFSVLFNQISEGMPNKTPSQKMVTLAARWWWLVTLPALLDVAASTGAPKDDKDKEKYLEALTYGQVLYFGRSIPLAGDVAESFFKDREARYGAWIGTLIRASKSAADLKAGKGNKADVKNLVDLLGAASGLPAGAAKNAFEFASKYTSGSMEEPVRDLLFRNPSEFK